MIVCRCGDMLVYKVKSCGMHPDVLLRTPDERMDFEREFDENLERSRE